MGRPPRPVSETMRRQAHRIIFPEAFRFVIPGRKDFLCFASVPCKPDICVGMEGHSAEKSSFSLHRLYMPVGQANALAGGVTPSECTRADASRPQGLKGGGEDAWKGEIFPKGSNLPSRTALPAGPVPVCGVQSDEGQRSPGDAPHARLLNFVFLMAAVRFRNRYKLLGDMKS